MVKFWNPQEACQPHLQTLSAAGMGGEENFLERFPRCSQLKSEDLETHTQTYTLGFTAKVGDAGAGGRVHCLVRCCFIQPSLEAYYVQGTRLDAEFTEMPRREGHRPQGAPSLGRNSDKQADHFNTLRQVY